MPYFAIFASKNDFVWKFASFRGNVCKDFSKIKSLSELPYITSA